MPRSLNLPAFRAGLEDQDGGYVTHTLKLLDRIDKKVRRTLYMLKGVKSENAVHAFFLAQDSIRSLKAAQIVAKGALAQQRKVHHAAIKLLTKGQTNSPDVDYDDPLLRKCIDFCYQLKFITDPKATARLHAQRDEIVTALKAANSEIQRELSRHENRAKTYTDKGKAVLANIEFLALKHGLYDDDRYDYSGRTLAQCKADASDKISKYVDADGTVEA